MAIVLLSFLLQEAEMALDQQAPRTTTGVMHPGSKPL
ncbi:MAG: hypothetical protein QOC87_1138 [Actinomycetota bacterium]|jgi:hypothetical protein|nr:hypothetical protein [Actinomycetota bacterium]